MPVYVMKLLKYTEYAIKYAEWQKYAEYVKCNVQSMNIILNPDYLDENGYSVIWHVYDVIWRYTASYDGTWQYI